jgi:hypothetical protein
MAKRNKIFGIHPGWLVGAGVLLVLHSLRKPSAARGLQGLALRGYAPAIDGLASGGMLSRIAGAAQ